MIEIVCSGCSERKQKKDSGSRFPNLCNKCSRAEREKIRSQSERRKEYRRIYYAEHREDVRIICLNWRLLNPERHTWNARKWQKENPEKNLKNKINFKNMNPGIFVEYSRIRRRKYPEENKINCNKRRARSINAMGSFSKNEWEFLIDKQNGRCFDCGDVTKLTIGHKIPLSKGGSNLIENIIGQCMLCNNKQHTKIHPKATLSLFDRMKE